jgi:adhesin/invasin
MQDSMRLALVTAVSLALAACGGGGGDTSPDATHLAFQGQPSTTAAGQPITPPVEVAILDGSGNLVSGATNAVTVAIAGGPSGATLGGTTTVNAASGVAAFSNLTIATPGTGYTLTASSSGLAGATSSTFDVSPVHGVATALAPVAGDGQSATVDQAVAVNPAVKVTDGFGDPVAQAPVTFAVQSGGGSATGLEQTTGADGVATVGGWTLGTTAGANTLSAQSSAVAGNPVVFTATGTAAAAAAIAIAAGDNQNATLSTPVATLPTVLVSDAFGNPVSGASVMFAVTSGGGSITGPSQATGADGHASVGSWTLGPNAGANTLEASSSGLTGSPLVFHAMAEPFPSAAAVEVHSNHFQSVRNGSGSGTGIPGSIAVDTIGVGGTVTWTWVDAGHNVTPYMNSAFTASPTQGPPATLGPVTFTAPGVYVYRCTIHSSVVADFLVGMQGEIVVR